MPFRSIAVPEELYEWLDNLNPPQSKPLWKKIQALRQGVSKIE